MVRRGLRRINGERRMWVIRWIGARYIPAKGLGWATIFQRKSSVLEVEPRETRCTKRTSGLTDATVGRCHVRRPDRRVRPLISCRLRPGGNDGKAVMVMPPLAFNPDAEKGPAGPAIVRPAPQRGPLFGRPIRRDHSRCGRGDRWLITSVPRHARTRAFLGPCVIINFGDESAGVESDDPDYYHRIAFRAITSLKLILCVKS